MAALTGADGWQCGRQASYVGTGGSQVAGGYTQTIVITKDKDVVKTVV